MNEAHFITLKLSGIAFIATLCSLPMWRGGCRVSGLVDAPGYRKIHEKPVPLAGGLAVFTGIVMAVGWMMITAGKAGHLPAAVNGRFWSLVGGSVAMLVLGLLDDRFELRAGFKFAGQLLIASSVCYFGLRLQLLPPGLDHLASVFWILAVTNAFNFMDNMNGLAAGLACIGSLAMGVVFGMHGDLFEALLCFALAGAVFGFLPFNYPRASAFLGDSGSHLLGFMMAAMPLNATMFGPSLSGSAVPILMVAVPLLDLVQVVAWRVWHRRPVWVGDRNHLSHRLVNWGLPPAVAVAVLWLLAAVVALIGMLLWHRG